MSNDSNLAVAGASLQLEVVTRAERLQLLGKSQAAVSLICEEAEGGIYKRIDEHRELVRLLIADAPEFISAHPWIASWVASQDRFLVALEGAVPFDPENCAYQKTETWPYAMPVLLG